MEFHYWRFIEKNDMDHYDYCARFIAPGERILDVGSGRGKFLCMMAKKHFLVGGVENNPTYIAESQKLLQQHEVEAEILHARAEYLPFPDNYFDFVNCAEVTEHVEDPVKVIHEIFRVLKKDGKCYISFHNRYGFYDYHYHLFMINWLPRKYSDVIIKLFGRQKADSAETGRHKLSSMHYYTFDCIQQILETAGFVVQDIRAQKIRQQHLWCSFIVMFFYLHFLRPYYFNTFHLLVEKI